MCARTVELSSKCDAALHKLYPDSDVIMLVLIIINIHSRFATYYYLT